MYKDFHVDSKKLLLASQLLDTAADLFSRQGCNDFKLPNTPDSVRLLNEMEQDNVGPGRRPEEVHVFDASKKELYTYDWSVARFLSRHLQEIAMGKKNNSQKSPSKPTAPTGGIEEDQTPTLTEPDKRGYVDMDAELAATQAKLTAAETANAELKEELKAAKAALAEQAAPSFDVNKSRARVAELMDGLRLWLHDYPNQILREKRVLPDDGSPLQHTLYLIMKPDGSIREIE